MTDNASQRILDNIGIRINLADLPTFMSRRILRNRLYGTWWRRLWWGHIAKLVIPRRHKRIMNNLEIVERQAMQELVDAVLVKGAMQ